MKMLHWESFTEFFVHTSPKAFSRPINILVDTSKAAGNVCRTPKARIRTAFKDSPLGYEIFTIRSIPAFFDRVASSVKKDGSVWPTHFNFMVIDLLTEEAERLVKQMEFDYVVHVPAVNTGHKGGVKHTTAEDMEVIMNFLDDKNVDVVKLNKVLLRHAGATLYERENKQGEIVLGLKKYKDPLGVYQIEVSEEFGLMFRQVFAEGEPDILLQTEDINFGRSA